MADQSDLSEWRRKVETRVAPKLEVEEPLIWGGPENCVICTHITWRWLMPENAPICSDECVEKYLKNPAVYDPRGIYTGGWKPNPSKRHKKPGKQGRRQNRPDQ